MNSETEKERSNYSLHYRAQFRDDWIKGEYKFNALDDNRAREVALSFVNEHNERDSQEIKDQKKSGQDWCKYKSLKLEKIAYVIKEVEERTVISLEGDVASRVKRGSLVELTELGNL